MTDDEFDRWRENYDRMSLAEHVAFYSDVFREHPIQRHGQFELCRQLKAIVFREGATVAEIGGWDGHLAERILAERADLIAWQNYELCRDVPVIADPRYQLIVSDCWVWQQSIRCDTLVMSHVLEHMRAANFIELLRKTTASVLWIESPLQPQFVQDWRGYGGTHVFEYGWEFVIGCLDDFRFKPCFVFGDVFLFRRTS